MDKLGFGLMRLPLTDPNDARSVNIPELSEMIDHYLENGFTYFDTAWVYHNGMSENAVKTALSSRHDRSSYTVATKLHSGFFNSREDMDNVFNTQLEKMGVEYFDYYLLHGIEADSVNKYEKFNCFEWMAEKKAAGLIKHAGFSFHASPEILEELLTRHPEVEFVQLQINYLDWEHPGIRARECYEICVKHQKPVFVMEPVRGGTLAKLPPKAEELMKAAHPDWTIASWAIRFAAGLENVKVVLSGMTHMDQVVDNVKTMKEMEPLSADDMKVLDRVLEIIHATNAISCTGCAYCAPGCPMNICIPQYFALYNVDRQEAADKGWHPQGLYFSNLQKTFGSPADCIECGQCEGMCPQHLPIIENLKIVNEYFG